MCLKNKNSQGDVRGTPYEMQYNAHVSGKGTCVLACLDRKGLAQQLHCFVQTEDTKYCNCVLVHSKIQNDRTPAPALSF